MIKILLVEDESEKKRHILEAALEITSLSIDNFVCVGDVREAKRALQSAKFDLLILDINLPPNGAQPTRADSGLDVIAYIKNNDRAIVPDQILCMSAYDESIDAVSDHFSSLIWRLVKFTYQDNEWRSLLQGTLNFLLSKKKPPFENDGHTHHIDLGIIVALEGVELRSVLSLPANWQPLVIPFDPTRYWLGEFSFPGRSLSVVAVAAPKMGMPTAAVTATKLISAFRPRLLAMTGICAGVKGKTEVGDVLIADPCFDWGSGKWILDKVGKELKFLPAPYQWRLNENLRSKVKSSADDAGLIDQIYASFTGKKPEKKPAVIVDAMASGGSVLQASQLMDDVREQHKNLVGVEMESYSIFTAAAYCGNPHPECISIKSVSDFGDDEKGDGYHEYAAHNSAHFFYHLAESLTLDDSI